jgi:hypothetical protein
MARVWFSSRLGSRFRGRDERPILAVPWPLLLLTLLLLATQVGWSLRHPHPLPTAQALGPAPTNHEAAIASLGEIKAYARLLNLTLQAHDNQPGISLPFRQLDYGRVQEWLTRILALDPLGQYPLLAASRLYATVDDDAKRRRMLEFVHTEFLRDPNRRWQWLAHAAYIARHEMKDMPLALRYAESLRRHATDSKIPAWARQMEIFLRIDVNDTDAAKALLGALLASGNVSDPAEFRFLAGRLAELEGTRPQKQASPRNQK